MTVFQGWEFRVRFLSAAKILAKKISQNGAWSKNWWESFDQPWNKKAIERKINFVFGKEVFYDLNAKKCFRRGCPKNAKTCHCHEIFFLGQTVKKLFWNLCCHENPRWLKLEGAKFFIFHSSGGRHSTEVAFALLTQQSRVRISVLPIFLQLKYRA